MQLQNLQSLSLNCAMLSMQNQCSLPLKVCIKSDRRLETARKPQNKVTILEKLKFGLSDSFKKKNSVDSHCNLHSAHVTIRPPPKTHLFKAVAQAAISVELSERFQADTL